MSLSCILYSTDTQVVLHMPIRSHAYTEQYLQNSMSVSQYYAHHHCKELAATSVRYSTVSATSDVLCWCLLFASVVDVHVLHSNLNFQSAQSEVFGSKRTLCKKRQKICHIPLHTEPSQSV